jgi:lysozyme
VSRLSKSVLALVAAGAGAAVIATQFVGEKEGLSLAAYQDGARVWTICRGHTEGVTPDRTATVDECDRLFAGELGKRLAAVDTMVTVPISEPRRAALASLCYNVGLEACRGSTLMRRINAGDPAACDEILRWTWVGGKDCREPENDCRGIVVRREQERALCLL